MAGSYGARPGGPLEPQQTDAEISHLIGHGWIAEQEGMIRAGLERQPFLLFRARSSRLRLRQQLLPGFIEHHGKAVGVIKQLARLVLKRKGHVV